MTKRITRETHSDYIDRIERKFKKLGNGAYANVYQHPHKDVVVKVFDAKDDRGYSRYLKWALKNQGNRFVPKIHGVEKFKNKDDFEEITVVFMEKLKSARSSDLDQLLEKAPRDLYLDEYDNDEWKEIAAVTKDPHLKALAKFFSKDLPGNLDLDLHSENYMLRPGTNQLVFTDPFA